MAMLDLMHKNTRLHALPRAQRGAGAAKPPRGATIGFQQVCLSVQEVSGSRA
jgi:hypothetical protein